MTEVVAEKFTDEELELRNLLDKNPPPSIVLELDGVLAFPNYEFEDVERRYGEAKPNKPLIRKLRELAKKEYAIIIHTSRGIMDYGNLENFGDVIGKVTQEWLEDNGVPYLSLQLGRPVATSYFVAPNAIDADKLLSVIDEMPEWSPPQEVKDGLAKMNKLMDSRADKQ